MESHHERKLLLERFSGQMMGWPFDAAQVRALLLEAGSA